MKTHNAHAHDRNVTGRFASLSEEKQHQAALPVLLSARRAVVFDGADAIDAIQQAGHAGIECWWARQALLSVIPSSTLQLWQADPSVKQSDRTRALDRAIRLCRRAFGHRGGWTVGTERLWRDLPRLLGAADSAGASFRRVENDPTPLVTPPSAEVPCGVAS